MGRGGTGLRAASGGRVWWEVSTRFRQRPAVASRRTPAAHPVLLGRMRVGHGQKRLATRMAGGTEHGGRVLQPQPHAQTDPHVPQK